MPKVLKFILVVVALCPIVLIIAKYNHTKILDFETKGTVTNIVWNSKNHGMPSITVKEEIGFKVFESNRITLQPSDILVGDKFVKKSNSKMCEINGIQIICIN